MLSIFAVSYTLALARPTPHHIPAGIVEGARIEPTLVQALERNLNGALDFRSYSAARAKHALATQQIFGMLRRDRGRPELAVAGAAGVQVARDLEQAANAVPASDGGPLRTVDTHPLPSSDPNGLSAFYVTIAATLLGFVTMFQLRANAPGVSSRGWLACITALALGGGLLMTVATASIIGALQGSFVELWAALATEVAIAALFNSVMISLLGRWAILPTWGLLVAIGNAASGGAVPAPLLPAFYGFVGRFLPNGATVETIRNIVYFPDHQQLEPILVLATWLLCSLAALLLAMRAGRVPFNK